MKMTLVGIFDRKAQAFIEMSPVANVAVASRGFSEAVNKPSDSPVHKWPADFELYELGFWDTETGRPEPLSDKRLITTGDALKSQG